MSEHVATTVAIVERDGDHLALKIWCSHEPDYAYVRIRGQVRALGDGPCSRPESAVHAGRRGDGHPDLCWSLRENADGTITGEPSVRVLECFHTARPWTLPLVPA